MWLPIATQFVPRILMEWVSTYRRMFRVPQAGGHTSGSDPSSLGKDEIGN
jgi:hypothetical protein